jgi:hypothetical protein
VICGTCKRSGWFLPRPQFDDNPEAARFMLGGWAGTVFAILAMFAGNPIAAIAVSVPTLGLFVLGVFA